MGEIILSILTPAVPSRLTGNASGSLAALCLELGHQIGGAPVEHLVFLDNKKRTVGEKRDALLRMARGAYVAFVDDDDWVSENYVSSILAATISITNQHPDVITFLQHATVNGMVGRIEFKLGNPNENFTGIEWDTYSNCPVHIPATIPTIKRNAWHICAWRRSLAIQSQFPASNYGEDWAFASRLCAIPNLREVHIPQVLHFYRHNSKTTEAPPPA